MAKKKNPIVWNEIQKVVITGASSGLGKVYAEELAKKGVSLIIVARRKERLQQLKNDLESEYKINVEVITQDLSIEQEIQKLSLVFEKRDDIDGLINNAGFGVKGNFGESEIKPQLDMLKVHTLAPTYLTQAVLPRMLSKNRGFIINLASLASYLPAGGSAMYSATKAFLRIFSQSLDFELEGTEVRIQALCPGFTHTEFHKSDELTEMKQKTPSILWMDAKKVILQSLKKLDKNKVVVVPGFINKVARYLFTNKIVGKWVIRAIQPKND